MSLDTIHNSQASTQCC